MSVDRRLLNWGIFLVLLGGVPLAVAQGWISRDVVEHAWELWPLILIGAGAGLILSATPLRALGGIVVSATFGIMLGSFVAVGFGGFSFGNLGCGAADPGAQQLVERSGSLSGDANTVRLTASCASVAVATAPGATWNVEVRGTENARPAIVDDADHLTVRSPDGSVVFPFSTRRASWAVTLGTDPRLDFGLELNAGGADVNLDGATLTRLAVDANAVGDTRLDLEGATVERLDVSVNAADVAILLPAGADMQGRVEGNAASVDLCAPAGVGLRLLVDDNITASDNYDTAGLVRSGSAWESPNFASAATRIELATVGSAVSYTLNPKDGCR
jgi:hypothetical protein